MLTSFFKKSLYRRLILYFTLLMLIPVIVCGYLLNRYSNTSISRNAMKMAEEIIDSTHSDLNRIFENISLVVSFVKEDETVQTCLRNLKDPENTTDLQNRLESIASDYPMFDGIYIYLDDSTVIRSRYQNTSETKENGSDDASLGIDDITTIKNHDDLQWYSSDKGSFFSNNLGNGVLMAACRLPDSTTSQTVGIVAVELRQSSIKKLIDGFSENNGEIFLVNAKDGIFLRSTGFTEGISQDTIDILKAISDSNENLNLDEVSASDKQLLAFSRTLSAANWMTIGLIEKSELQEAGRELLVFYGLTILFTVLCGLAVARMLANYEIKPIRTIQGYVRNVGKGVFGEKLEIERVDEIGDLAKSTEHMSERIGELMTTVKNNEENLRKAEFKALQAQINPHFLYNTLDSIKWMANSGDTKKTAEMISSLTAFFRISLSKGRDLISIREETEHAKSYLEIQKIRYEDKFDYLINIPDEINECIVPKLILQPLVENALYHGIKETDRKCMLFIQAIADSRQIQLEVIDNGAGIDAQTAESLRKALLHEGNNPTDSYGLVNVNDRIQNFTSREYGISFESEPGIGTSVKILLPRQKGDSDV